MNQNQAINTGVSEFPLKIIVKRSPMGKQNKHKKNNSSEENTEEIHRKRKMKATKASTRMTTTTRRLTTPVQSPQIPGIMPEEEDENVGISSSCIATLCG